MPKICGCPRCVKFRDRPENQPRISRAAYAALQKANTPSLTSRRSLIEAGKGKTGQGHVGVGGKGEKHGAH